MINLATLIGVKNLETLISKDENTYFVIEDTTLKVVKNNQGVDYSKVVGVGTFQSCNCLLNYLQLTKLVQTKS